MKRLFFATVALDCAIGLLGYLGLQFAPPNSSNLKQLIGLGALFVVLAGIPGGLQKTLLAVQTHRSPYCRWNEIAEAPFNVNKRGETFATALFLWPPAVTSILCLASGVLFSVLSSIVSGNIYVTLVGGFIGLLEGAILAFLVVIIPMALGILFFRAQTMEPAFSEPASPVSPSENSSRAIWLFSGLALLITLFLPCDSLLLIDGLTLLGFVALIIAISRQNLFAEKFAGWSILFAVIVCFITFARFISVYLAGQRC